MGMNGMLDLPCWEQLPDIGLYMDQVVTLTQRALSPALGGEITRSMVNNYVKMKLIPRPAGKKYEREHLAMLLMIGVLKQALSISAVGTILRAICADGIERGYAHFLRETAHMSDLVCGLCEGTCVPPEQTGTREEQALRMGIAAALCTMGAYRLLQAEENGSAPTQNTP